jgi:GDP-4-dehydro-6-deoxy-D-mannose reductase
LTKAACERIALHRGAIVVRSFNLVGPGQAPGFALPSFAEQLRAMRRGERPLRLLVGNLAARRDFLHIEDGAAAYELLAERGVCGETYNLASGKALSISDVLSLLLEVSGLEVAIEVDAQRMRPADLPLLVGDPTRLRRLGWEPRHTLRDAMAALWRETMAAP